MVYTNRPLPNYTGFLPGTKNIVSGGVTITIPSGYDFDEHGNKRQHDEPGTLSVQSNGSYEWRPLGTEGPFEVGQQDGDKIVFTPDGNIWVIGVVEP